MTTFNSISEFTNNVSRGTFGITLIAVTEPKMNKRGNPFYGRVKKATYMSNVALGYDYENTINARLERKGEEGNYQSEKPKGKSWLEYPYILQSDKDENVKYLRCTIRPNTATKTLFILDGEIVTDADTIIAIKDWMPKSAPCAKQTESGLSDDEQVIVRDYKLDGILCLTQGEKVFNRIGLIDAVSLRKVFEK